MRYYVDTIRNGRELLGNVGHARGTRNDLKTLRGAIAWAQRLAKHNAQPGDEIVIKRATTDYGLAVVAAKFIAR